MPVKRVLVIQGEVDARRNLTAGLSSHGFDVRACKDGVTAIHELEQSHSTATHFDYVITDAALTDISGMKILKVLKAAWPKLPMLVVSEGQDDALAQEVGAYGNAVYLSMPAEVEGVVSALGKLETGETTEEHKHLAEATDREINAKAYVFGKLEPGADGGSVAAELKNVQGVGEVRRVEGEIDVIAICWQRSMEDLESVLANVRAVPGLEVVKANYVIPAHLEEDVSHFIEDYNYALEKTVEGEDNPQPPFAYLIVDIDPAELQAIFTKMFFLDNSTECEVTGGGTRVIAYVCEADTPQYALDLKLLGEMEGVLRIRQASVIGD